MQTSLHKSMRVTPIEGHRIWAAGYDRGPSPLLALETRVVLERLPALPGFRFLDVACGTGRWMRLAQQRGAQVSGVDLCPEMLREAARKPGLAGRLSIGDASRLPVVGGASDFTLCSFALGYVASLRKALCASIEPSETFLAPFWAALDAAPWRHQ